MKFNKNTSKSNPEGNKTWMVISVVIIRVVQLSLLACTRSAIIVCLQPTYSDSSITETCYGSLYATFCCRYLRRHKCSNRAHSSPHMPMVPWLRRRGRPHIAHLEVNTSHLSYGSNFLTYSAHVHRINTHTRGRRSMDDCRTGCWR